MRAAIRTASDAVFKSNGMIMADAAPQRQTLQRSVRPAFPSPDMR